jgi:hypothetical protein
MPPMCFVRPNKSPDCVKSRPGGALSLRACADWHGSGARVLCRRAILASSGNAIRDFGVFTQPLAGSDAVSGGFAVIGDVRGNPPYH